MRKLRWLNGPLAGREFDLPLGTICIGGADADIALTLEQGVEAVLTHAEDGVTVEPDIPVWVDGQRWPAAQMLPHGAVIDLAGQAFVLGQAEETLPLRRVPERVIDDGDVQPSIWQWGMVGVAIVALLGALVLLAPRQPEAAARFNPEVWLAQQLRADNLKGLRVTRDQNGVLVIGGRCASSDSVRRLQLRLREEGLLVRDESLCADMLRTNVRNMLLLNGYADVDVMSGVTPGTVEIRGAIVANQSWQHVVEQLQALPGLQSWHVVNDRAEWFERLRGRLAAHISMEGISITLSGKTLVISGKIEPARERELLAVVDAFNQESQQGFQAMFQNMPSIRSATELLLSPVVTIGGNLGSIYVELANGMRLQQGGVLPNGYLIAGLSRTSIALLKEQHLISVPFDL